ncbi:CGL97 [Auxenochlorella protothecoides x Auxenochlorella symbiontica]
MYCGTSVRPARLTTGLQAGVGRTRSQPCRAFGASRTRGYSPVQASSATALSGDAVRLVSNAFGAVRCRLTGAWLASIQKAQSATPEDVSQQIRTSVKQMKLLTLLAPFAAVSGSAGSLLVMTKAVASFIKLYLLLLFLRVLLSWFPTFTWWDQQPWLALRQVTDPYLKLFSGLVPPLLGTIDLTPLVGFFILQFLAGFLVTGTADDMFW